MKRRQFLQGAALGGATALGAPAVHAEKRFQWKMVTSWPPNFPIFQDGAERFARELDTMSGGRLHIEVYPGGALVPPLQVFDAVSQGTVQMGHSASYYWAGKVPAAQFFTTVPFGMNAQGMNAWMYQGGGLELWREVYKPFDVHPIAMGNTGVQMGGWFRKEINHIADLKGLKMRIPGLGGKVMARAGADPVLMAGGEIYTALERGTLDATEWAGPFHDMRLGLQRAAKYYYYPGWHEAGPVLELSIHRRAWQSLPSDLQRMVETAAASANLWMLCQFEAKNLAALRELQSHYKVKILAFPDEVIHALHGYTRRVLHDEAAADKTFARVYREYERFRKVNDAWRTVSEAAYARARKL
jgi:TRAP-type mannitol/chloroaromatic compound transport system substrate-binding protein